MENEDRPKVEFEPEVYKEGILAFDSGERSSTRYRNIQKRLNWYDGYYWAKYLRRHRIPRRTARV